MKQILLLEDDEALGRGIGMALETPECAVTRCAALREAEALLLEREFDLLILDITLPDGTGFAVCEAVRAAGSSVPIECAN